MSEKKDNKETYCVYCGAKIKKNQVYCPNCGKLAVIKSSNKNELETQQISQDTRPLARQSYSRKCSGCGSIINSSILEQCPICNSLLEPIPETLKVPAIKTGFIFTEKKLEAEQSLVLKKDSWTFREGLNVFTNSILVYITVQLFLIMFIWFQYGFNDTNQPPLSETTIFLIIISQIPGILLGIFPLFYISTNRHSYEKLGFPAKNKKIFSSIIIGIIGCIVLLSLSFISGYLINIFYDLGLNLIDIQEYMEMESTLIRNAGIWVIILIIELVLNAIAVEIVFRGVLHNTLRQRFSNDPFRGKIITILLVAVAYSGIYILFSFPIGIYFLIPNFISFVILGFLYEINKNIFNTILASIFYNISLIVLILYF